MEDERSKEEILAGFLVIALSGALIGAALMALIWWIS